MSTPSNLARDVFTDPYDGSFESKHRVALIVVLVVLMSLIVIVPHAYLLRIYLRKRAADKRQAKINQMIARKAASSDADSEKGSIAPVSRAATPMPEESDLELGPILERPVKHTEMFDSAGQAPQDADRSEDGETRGAWHTIAAKRAG